MTAQHTPGPWIIDESGDKRTGTHIRADTVRLPGAIGGVSICRMTPATHGYATAAANARLIASSPRLLAELEALANAIARGREPDMTRAAYAVVLADAERSARAVIAEAKGDPKGA